MYQMPGFTLEADDDDEEKLRNLLHAHSSHVSDVRIRYTGMGPYHTSADALVPVPVTELVGAPTNFISSTRHHVVCQGYVSFSHMNVRTRGSCCESSSTRAHLWRVWQESRSSYTPRLALDRRRTVLSPVPVPGGASGDMAFGGDGGLS